MEPRCRSVDGWFGKVKFTLGSQLYTDYSTDEALDRVADDLCKVMRQELVNGQTVSEWTNNYQTEQLSLLSMEPTSSSLDVQESKSVPVQVELSDKRQDELFGLIMIGSSLEQIRDAGFELREIKSCKESPFGISDYRRVGASFRTLITELGYSVPDLKPFASSISLT